MTQPDLLIIGAGPVGLTLACEARRNGLSVRIIDKRESASIHSKAQLVHARTLELLDDLGIVDRFLSRGIVINSFNVFEAGSTKRVAQLTIVGLDSRYQGMLSISQHDTEVLLAERLAELGVEVERQVTLESFTQDDEAVTATLIHDADGGRKEILTVPWLAGCDGAHSTVRHTLELPFEGEKYPMHVIQTDARVDLPFDVHEDEVVAFAGAGAVAGLFPLPGGEHRYRFLVPGAYDEDLEPTLEDFQAILDAVAPAGATVSDPKWMVGFRIHCRMTPKFRVGRVFLAGDAGHIHSPAGGQGMNMGIQDSYNLAWKLALRHRGEGTEELLESYSAERHPTAAATLGWTDRITKTGLKALGLENKLILEARNRLAGFVTSLGLVQRRVARVFSMLDVAYNDSPVCDESRAGLLRSNVRLDPTNEKPSVLSWYAFSGGPKPGHRAPDATINPEEPDSTRLHDLFRGTSHTLLLFDGAAPTAEGYANLTSIAETLTERFGDRIQSHIVVPSNTRPDKLEFDGSVLLDAGSELHSAYAADTECLYLIRPDGYVGFRSQPAQLDDVANYVKRILI